MTDGRPLSDLIELDEHTRKCLAFEATLTDRQIDMLQELGYLPVIMRQYLALCLAAIPVARNRIVYIVWRSNCLLFCTDGYSFDGRRCTG